VRLDEALRPLFRQAASDPCGKTTFGPPEVSRWPNGFLRSLENSNVIEAGSRVESIICPGCPRACVVAVTVSDHNRFVRCDQRDVDYGLIEVDATDMRLWQASRSRLVAFVARELKLSPDNHTDATDRVRLGTWKGARARRAASLEFTNRVTLRIGDDEIDLADLVTWDGTRIRIDKEELEIRANQSADPQVGGKRYQRSRSKQQRAANYTRLRNERLQMMADDLKDAHPTWKKAAIAEAILRSREFMAMNIRISKATTLERIIRVPRK
jgi:hypothetical protein